MCLGVPMKVVAVSGDGMARVTAGEVSLDVSTMLLETVAVGEYVLVHAGFAIEVMDGDAAGETLRLLNELTIPESDAAR